MIVGIDLGTTNSLIGVWQDEAVTLIPNALGNVLTPSVVGIDENNNVLVGTAVFDNQQVVAAGNFVCNIKRYMGTKKTFTLAGRAFSAIELSALILKSLKHDAENYLGEAITEAVISVPAYFNDTQRKATRAAAEIAGLRVERLINEPTAAALAYGINNRCAETKFLVFDLGGGTFDVSVVEIFSGIIEVRASAGDNDLGGSDVDTVMLNLATQKFYEDANFTIDFLPVDKWQALMKDLQDKKHLLSQQNSVEVVCYEEGIRYCISISRQELYEALEDENYCGGIIKRIERPIKVALQDSRLQPTDLDAVVLVGGATRMPIIRQLVARIFGHFPLIKLNPDETVAIGTCIQAALKQRDKALKDVVITDVCPFSLGTSVLDKMIPQGHSFFPILERNTTIPVSRVKTLVTTADFQNFMTIDIYQGESFRIEENVLIGELTIPLQPKPAGKSKVDVRYSYDINGLLEVEATEVATGKVISKIFKNYNAEISPEEIAISREKLQAYKILPIELSENKNLLAQLEQLYQQQTGELRAEIADAIRHFNTILQCQDEKRITKARHDMQDFITYVKADIEK